MKPRRSQTGRNAHTKFRAGGRLGTWVLVLGLLCLAVILASCSRAPLTGRRQLLLISEPDEMRLGATAYTDLLAESRLSTDEAAADRVRAIGTRIADATGKTDYEWEFNLIEADTVVNAFCLPGGKVGVYTGITKLATTDPELATVMSHEIAHAIARHGGERMSQMLVVQLGGIALDEALKTKTQKTVDLARVAYGVGSTLAFVLPYSRKHESEADYIGLMFMAKAGYDPRASVDFWRKMQEKHAGEEPPEFLSTHPASSERIDDLRKWMPEALKYYEARK